MSWLRSLRADVICSALPPISRLGISCGTVSPDWEIEFDVGQTGVLCLCLGPYFNYNGMPGEELADRQDTTVFKTTSYQRTNDDDSHYSQLGAVSCHRKGPIDWVPQTQRLRDVLAKFNSKYFWVLESFWSSVVDASNIAWRPFTVLCLWSLQIAICRQVNSSKPLVTLQPWLTRLCSWNFVILQGSFLLMQQYICEMWWWGQCLMNSQWTDGLICLSMTGLNNSCAGCARFFRGACPYSHNLEEA